MEARLSSVGDGGVITAGAGSAGAVAARRACVLSPPPESTATFVASTEWLDSGVPVVSVTGELDLTTASTLEETLLTLPDNGAGTVIVDLAGCSFIDLRGLHVLLAARERLERANRPLALVLCNPSLLRVLQITRVEALFEIYPSLAAAGGRDDDG